jgi:mycothiol maleylpyruvate isomerase-like protein
MRAPAYLVAARTAAALIAQPAVTSRWTDPSALTGFTVGGLAAHLAGQVFSVSRLLEADPATEELVPLLEHYARAAWVGADLDADVNVGIRSSG